MKTIIYLSLVAFVAVVAWLHGFYTGKGYEDREQ
jgi:hypothetical protein